MTLNEAQPAAVPDVVMGDDPYLWLEDIESEPSLAWVERHNAPTVAAMSGDRFEKMRADALDIFDSDTRIPGVGRAGRLSLQLLAGRGPSARTVAAHHARGVPQGLAGVGRRHRRRRAGRRRGRELGVGRRRHQRTRVHPCGRRAVTRRRGRHVVREFDMTTRQFVADGFHLPEAKSDVDFEDDDTVLVSTDFGEGSLTESGYPRLIKRWRRGTALEDAETVFSGSTSDVGVGMTCSSEPGFERTLFYRMVDFYHKETFELRDGELIRLDIPDRLQHGGAPRVGDDPPDLGLVQG